LQEDKMKNKLEGHREVYEIVAREANNIAPFTCKVDTKYISLANMAYAAFMAAQYLARKEA